MTWINTVSYEESAGDLRNLYDRIKGPDNNVDNIMLAHSLRPHTMQGHMTLYKYVLHHPRNALPKAYLEAIGVYVSSLNDCQYCVEHHFAGMARLLNDDKRAAAGLEYAASLTLNPGEVAKADIDALREAGLDDGEILEINQVTAYFSYANRTVLGLGVATDGDIIGLSPGDSSDPDNWSHA
jgi:AhpD family alkylhydroperoxidase